MGKLLLYQLFTIVGEENENISFFSPHSVYFYLLILKINVSFSFLRNVGCL